MEQQGAGLVIYGLHVQSCPFCCHAVTIDKSPTHAPLFTKQYKLIPAKGTDAPKQGRWPRAWLTIMAAYCRIFY